MIGLLLLLNASEVGSEGGTQGGFHLGGVFLFELPLKEFRPPSHHSPTALPIYIFKSLVVQIQQTPLLQNNGSFFVTGCCSGIRVYH